MEENEQNHKAPPRQREQKKNKYPPDTDEQEKNKFMREKKIPLADQSASQFGKINAN